MIYDDSHDTMDCSIDVVMEAPYRYRHIDHNPGPAAGKAAIPTILDLQETFQIQRHSDRGQVRIVERTRAQAQMTSSHCVAMYDVPSPL